MRVPFHATDTRILFLSRAIRLFAYGLLSVVLVFYLVDLGLSEKQVGLLLSLTLVGDTLISLWLTTHADRIGRKRTLLLGALLMIGAGAVFASAGSFLVLLCAAIVGVISPSGNEVGPFLSVEQASLAELVPSHHRTQTFAWYNLLGSFTTAGGALASGFILQFLQAAANLTTSQSYRGIVVIYGAFGLLLFAILSGLSGSIETKHPIDRDSLKTRWLGLTRSRRFVLGLSALFALDAFAGGFIIQSILAYWFHVKFGIDIKWIGTIFFGANILAGISALSAARVARRFGLLNTMVFTHLPSNLLLILVPFMPNITFAIALLLLRFSISQMDVPTRQSYTMAVVDKEERSAAAGITNVARTIGASLAPVIAAPCLVVPALFNAPFFIAGGLKIIYDLILYRAFRSTIPAEEIGPTRT
ncbi:MAG: MFS transporter [Deltaproteobacteria bacterium]|nr:MFS transporter [Deltaproteobacteria bacterium]